MPDELDTNGNPEVVGEPEGQEEEDVKTDEVVESSFDPLEALASPEAVAILNQRVEEALALRDLQERQAKEYEDAKNLPDEELGALIKAQIQEREAMQALFPEVSRQFYSGVVADLIAKMPELRELTPEEQAAILSPNLKTDADVLRVLTETVGSKRAAKAVEEAKKTAVDEYLKAKENESASQSNRITVPNLPGGQPAPTTSDEVDPHKLWGNYFAQKDAGG